MKPCLIFKYDPMVLLTASSSGKRLTFVLDFHISISIKIIKKKLNEQFLNNINWQVITKMHNFHNCSTHFFPFSPY